MVELLSRKKEKETIDPNGRIVINQSRVKAWRQCHRMHWYKYEEKLGRKRVKRPLMFGKLVHNMIEVNANGDDPMAYLEEEAKKQRKMFARELEIYGDIVADLRFIMGAYFEYWENHPDRLRYTRFNKKASEHTFEIELIPGLLWKGTIDAFGRCKSLRWLVEHKTFKKEWSEDDRWRNLQSATYRRAAKMMGWPHTDGMMWDYVHSKPPTRPKLLKSGDLSTRDIVTLPEVVIDFAEKNPKVNPITVEKLMAAAEANLNRYFMRIYTPANEDVEEKIFEDFLETAYEIADDHDRKKARNIGKHCGWCDFETLCRTELTGGDVDFIRKREYEIEKDEHKSRSEVERSED